MKSFIQRLAGAFSVIALAAALVSCGGSSGGGASTDSSQAQGKGTVGILLTDKPADPAMFAAIIASITRVELMGSEENGPITLYEGPPTKEFDLLRLRNESIPLAFKDDVPAGTYCKIRLILSDLELVLVDDTPNNLSNNPTEHPKLPGNGKLDLVARDCFEVVAGEVLALQLDIDAGKSIHIVENPSCTNNVNKSCFNFRPVIFVDVIDKDFDSKLVRLSGVIEEVYSDSQYLLLCDAIPHESMNNLGCVKVRFDTDYAAFFDSNAPWDGAPRAISDLLVDANEGEELTVVGWAKSWASKDNDDDKPAEYHPLLHLDALVAELGDFRRVEGKVDDVNATIPTNSDDPWFSMCLLSDCPQNTDSLAVRFQPGETGINGTRIVSKSGVLLKPEDIELFLPVQVDGTPDNNTSPLYAALVIVDKSALDTEQVTGVIQSLGIDTLELKPDAYPCGVTDPFIVDLINPLDILTVITDVNGSEILPGGILKKDQTVGMNGSCVFSGNYQTDNIVIVVDQ